MSGVTGGKVRGAMGNKTGRDECGREGSNGRKPWCEEIATEQE